MANILYLLFYVFVICVLFYIAFLIIQSIPMNENIRIVLYVIVALLLLGEGFRMLSNL